MQSVSSKQLQQCASCLDGCKSNDYCNQQGKLQWRTLQLSGIKITFSFFFFMCLCFSLGAGVRPCWSMLSQRPWRSSESSVTASVRDGWKWAADFEALKAACAAVAPRPPSGRRVSVWHDAVIESFLWHVWHLSGERRAVCDLRYQIQKTWGGGASGAVGG